MRKFNSLEVGIAIVLSLFEKPVKRGKLDANDWVLSLLPCDVSSLLPPEIVQLIDEWAKFTLPTKLAVRLDEYDSICSTTSKSFGAIPKGRVAEKV
ncbi:hypothetical protein CDAR_484671 [Caerostris darwini]|uniref:Uncharacterized protein n=1 Tax=Caerostris darwini TaxID=1538125 RepID=A0AAV4S8V4_9ARAC|nr:hypothetical protein CDAR_484671 [Caerostris darwini]